MNSWCYDFVYLLLLYLPTECTDSTDSWLELFCDSGNLADANVDKDFDLWDFFNIIGVDWELDFLGTDKERDLLDFDAEWDFLKKTFDFLDIDEKRDLLDINVDWDLLV